MIVHRAAIAWAVDVERRRIALVHHRHFGWSCPGGHVEPGESPAAAAARELAEETGVCARPAGDEPFRVTRNDGCARDPSAIDEMEHFRFDLDSTEPLHGEPDQPAEWFAWDDLPRPRIGDVDVVLAELSG